MEGRFMSIVQGFRRLGGSHRLAVAVSLVGLAILLLANRTAKGGNIFDDDWTPPKRTEKSADRPVAPVQDPPAVPNPGTPEAVVKPPPVNPSETVAAPPSHALPPTPHVRLPIPEKADTARCRKLFKDAFADQLKDRSGTARRKLAKSLLEYAAKPNNAPADTFVLLTGAIEAAEEGASLRLSFKAAEELSSNFNVDESATKIEVADKVWSIPPTGSASVANVQATIDLIDQLAAEEDFATAVRLDSSLQHLAAHVADWELKVVVQNHAKDLAAARDGQSKLAQSMEKIKSSPDDAAANSAVGDYLCFVRGNWEKGLPFLAKGEDATVKALAGAEVRKPEGVEAMATVADGWWNAAAKMTGAKRMKTLQHAVGLYRNALADSSGLRRLTIEKRLAEAPAASDARRIDLLDLLDCQTDAVSGKWHWEDGAVSVEPSVCARIEFPYIPSDEYDFRIGFVIVRGDQGPEQICSAAGHQFQWVNGGWGNTVCGFEMIQGRAVIDNPTTKRSKQWFAVGQHYTAVVKVRKSGLEAFVNDKRLSNWKTDYADMSQNDPWQLTRVDVLGLGAYNSAVKCDFAEVIEITGKGKFLR
jgi:hypothetical protein